MYGKNDECKQNFNWEVTATMQFTNLFCIPIYYLKNVKILLVTLCSCETGYKLESTYRLTGQ
jgi:hypothetical protein